MKKLYLFILTLVYSSTITLSQPDLQSLDNYIKESVEKFNIPGLAAAIIKDGEVVLNKGYGFRDLTSRKEVTPETVFGLASVSKAFTAACLAILVDKKMLNWNDKVIDHLPWFRLYDNYAANDLMVIDLLCHRSGLGTFDGDLLWYGTDYSREEVVRRIRFQKPKHSIRSRYGYQNVMYIAAGEVIKSVTGISWDQFLKENILDPLEMYSTNTSNSGFTKDDNVSLPHVKGLPQPFINYDNSGPAASVNSNTNDLLKWAAMWLNKGEHNGKEILSKTSVEKLISPQTVIAGGGNEAGGTHFYLYALGWQLSDYSGRRIIEHSGGLPGVHTVIVLVPEDNLGIILLANDISPLIPSVQKRILDFYLNEKDIDYTARNLKSWADYNEKQEKKISEKEKQRAADTTPSLPVTHYTGIYTDIMYGDAEVSLNGNDLILTLLPTKELFTSRLEHWHYDTFRIKFNDPFLPEGFVTFYIDGNGNVKNFTIDLPNPDFHFFDHDFIKVSEKKK